MLPSHSSADKPSSTRDKLSSFLSLPWRPSPVSGLLLVNILLPADSEVGATFEGVSTVLHSRGRALRWLQQDKHSVLCTLRTKLALSGTQGGPWGRTHERRHTSVLPLCAVQSGLRHAQLIAADKFSMAKLNCIPLNTKIKSNASLHCCLWQIFISWVALLGFFYLIWEESSDSGGQRPHLAKRGFYRD